ncbi:MAG: hypothetical protein C3F11_11690 [Methylocystaceae bacterium]|nr:MAG: hypothetical protein C3F11_11690 [Methylocystaceae bacterium]
MTSGGVEKMIPSTIGVDVSKDWLDAHRLADGAARRFANDKIGRKALIKWMGATPVKRVVFEPTGPYHRALERGLDAAGLPIAKVNPRQARRFAEAAGKLVKTDRAARRHSAASTGRRPCRAARASRRARGRGERDAPRPPCGSIASRRE